MSGTNALDLHGKTWTEALEAFLEFYNASFQRAEIKLVGSIDVVHGYGSTGEGGVIRGRLRGFLQRYPDHLEFRIGENVDSNAGHTIVIPLKILPSIQDQLEERVWSYCKMPRARSKISGRFHRYGDREVIRALRHLENEKRVKVIHKGAVRVYQAV